MSDPTQVVTQDLAKAEATASQSEVQAVLSQSHLLPTDAVSAFHTGLSRLIAEAKSFL